MGCRVCREQMVKKNLNPLHHYQNRIDKYFDPSQTQSRMSL